MDLYSLHFMMTGERLTHHWPFVVVGCCPRIRVASDQPHVSLMINSIEACNVVCVLCQFLQRPGPPHLGPLTFIVPVANVPGVLLFIRPS